MTGGKKPTENMRTIWICPECCCFSKKGDDNSMTPVVACKRGRDPNVTHRKNQLHKL